MNGGLFVVAGLSTFSWFAGKLLGTHPDYQEAFAQSRLAVLRKLGGPLAVGLWSLLILTGTWSAWVRVGLLVAVGPLCWLASSAVGWMASRFAASSGGWPSES